MLIIGYKYKHLHSQDLQKRYNNHVVKMITRHFLAVFIVSVSISVIGGSPHKKSSEPPPQIDEDVPNISSRGKPPPRIDEDVPNISSRGEVVIGDMILPIERFKKNTKHARVKRRPYDNDYKWPKSGTTVTVPYTKSGIDSDVLQRAIEVFNAKTCIRFEPRVSETNYVTFQSGSSCSAQVAYRASVQTCTLTSSCAGKKGKVLHEMMHILGFLHEQCRRDRDSYVTIHENNIRSGAEANFAISDVDVDQSIPYDCDSILHYKATAFSTSTSAATISSSSYCTTFGNDDTRLSVKDYKRINTFYSCDPNPTYRYFTVRVVTDSSWYTGTDCYIYIKLHGSQRTSTEFELDLDDAGSSNLFESNSDDTFSKMAFRDDLGSITGISIRMVSHGSGEGWWPNTFTVTDPVNNEVKTFTSNQWMYPSSTYEPSAFPVQSSK